MAQRKLERYHALPPTASKEGRDLARERLRADTRRFLKAGGSVQRIPRGQSGYQEGGRKHIRINPAKQAASPKAS